MKKLFFGLLSLVCAGGANAATFDFAPYPGMLGSDTLVLTGGTFVGLEGRLNADGNHHSYGSICAVDAIAFSCEADLRLDFDGAVSALTFETFDFQLGDSVTISIFNGATLLSSLVIASDALVDFSAFGGVTSVLFDDSSVGGNGFAYGNFFFEPQIVPLPAGAPLLLTGFAFLAANWRRAKKS